MQTQPEFYRLEFFSDANFWTVGDASTRRTFLMPLSNPGEFLGFGVLSPSNELIFVARGRVIDHLGPFIARMKQAGATVELYARAPLPGHIIHEYTKGGPHDQRETDVPPRAPNLVGEVTLSGASTTSQPITTGMDLWSTGPSGAKRVVALPIPTLSGEWLAFGLVKVENMPYNEAVPFVARLSASEVERGDALGGQSVSTEGVPRTLQQYMDDNFPPTVGRASGNSSAKGSSVLIA